MGKGKPSKPAGKPQAKGKVPFAKGKVVAPYMGTPKKGSKPC